MTWYKTGKISVANGSKIVTGTGTDFIPNVTSGFGMLGPDFSIYEVDSIQSVGQLTLATPYRGADADDQDYAIWQTQGVIPDLVRAATDLLSTFGALRDAYADGDLVGQGLEIKGVLSNVSELPAEPAAGDAYLIGASIYVFIGTGGWQHQDIAGISPRGNWNADTAYAVNDVVTYAGSSFRRIVAGVSDDTPGEDGGNWDVFVQRGAIGPAGITPRGAWHGATAYVVNDTATFKGSQWRRLVAGTSAVTPEHDSANWELFLSKGQDGLGAVVTVNEQGPDEAGNVALVKKDIGLGNVDNTSDSDKPISVLQQAALDAKLSVTQGSLSGMRNRVINGNMRVNQMGVARVSTDGQLIADTWRSSISVEGNICFVGSDSTNCSSTGGKSLFVYNQGPAKPVLSASDVLGFYHRIEGNHIADLLWGTAHARPITISFRAYASQATIIAVSVRNAGNSYVAPVALAQGLSTYVVTIPGPTSGTWANDETLGLQIMFAGAVGATLTAPTANAWIAHASNMFYLGAPDCSNICDTVGRNFAVSDVQLEGGVVATPFEILPQAQRLSLCYRYYYKKQVASMTAMVTTLGFSVPVAFPVTMRSVPAAFTNIAGSNYVATQPTAGTAQWCLQIAGIAYTSSSALMTVGFIGTSIDGSNLIGYGSTLSAGNALVAADVCHMQFDANL